VAVVVAAVGIYRRRSEEEGGGRCPGPGAATRRQGMRGGVQLACAVERSRDDRWRHSSDAGSGGQVVQQGHARRGSRRDVKAGDGWAP
jgi:hypothetical protein